MTFTNISRVKADPKNRRGAGWYARMNHGKKRLLAFSDSECGSEENALKAAQLARAHMWLSYIIQKQSLTPRAENRPTLRNKTGIPGVSRGQLKSGENTYPYWCAYYRNQQHRFFDHHYRNSKAAFREAKRRRFEMIEAAREKERQQFQKWFALWGQKAKSPASEDVLLAYQKAVEMAGQ
jgi:hypothetical protein